MVVPGGEVREFQYLRVVPKERDNLHRGVSRAAVHNTCLNWQKYDQPRQQGKARRGARTSGHTRRYGRFGGKNLGGPTHLFHRYSFPALGVPAEKNRGESASPQGFLHNAARHLVPQRNARQEHTERIWRKQAAPRIRRCSRRHNREGRRCLPVSGAMGAAVYHGNGARTPIPRTHRRQTRVFGCVIARDIALHS